MEMITLLGVAAAVCTTLSFLPQAIKTIKTKHTKDLSFGTYSFLTGGIILWFVYGILIKDWPIILANGVSGVFSGIILYMKIKYG